MNLVNARTGLGIVGEDPTLDDVPYLTADPDLADIQAMWSGSALAERIVCTPVGDILSAGFDFSPVGEQADGELPDKVKAYLEARGWPLVRWEAMTKARIFGGAAAVVTFEDGEDIEEPVHPDNIQTVRGFMVADRYELRPIQWSVKIGPYYNRPILYSLHPWVPGAPAPSEDDFRTHGQLIHASRVIPFVGKYVPERLSDGYARGWSDSVLRAVRQKLIDLYRVHRGVARLVVNIAERIIKDPSLFAKLDTMTDAEFVALLRRNKMASSFNGDRVLPPDASVEWTAPPTTGVRDLVLETMVALAGATSPGMPVEKLFGIAPPGGLDGAGEYVRDNYWSNLDQARTYHVIPNERRAIDFALMAKDGPTGGRPVIYTLTGGAFKIETDQERAQRLQTESGAASTYVQMGALHPMEVRASLKKAEQTLWQLEDQYDDELAQGGQGGLQMPGGDLQGQMAAMGGGEEPPPSGSTPPDGGPGPRNDSDDWTDDDDAVAGEMEEWAGSEADADESDEDELERADAAEKAGVDADRFVPPESVQNAARAALERRKEGQKGGLSSKEAGKQGIGSGVVRAAQLASGKAVSPRVVRRINAFFGRFGRFKDAPLDSKGKQAYQLWGGAAAERWASALVDDMDAARMDAGEWTRFDAEFNEDLHPRDHGKFAKKGEGESAGGQKVELKKPLGEHSVEELQGLYQQLYGKPGNITNVANLKTWVKKGLEAEGGHAGKVAMLKEHYKAVTGKETGIPHEPQLKYAVNQALKKAGKEPITDWSGFYESKAGAGPEKGKDAPLESPVTIPMPALKEKVGEIAADPGLKPAEKTEAIDAVIAQHHAAVDAQEGAQGAEGPSSGKALADMTPDELNAHLKGLDLPGLQAAYQEVHGVPTTTTTAANLKTWIKQGLSPEHKAQVAHLQQKLEAATGKKTSIAKVPQLKHALNNALKAKGEEPITDWSELETVAKGAAKPSPEVPAEAPTISPAAGESSEPAQEAPAPAAPRTKLEQMLDAHDASADVKARVAPHVKRLEQTLEKEPHLKHRLADGGERLVNAMLENDPKFEADVKKANPDISPEKLEQRRADYHQGLLETMTHPSNSLLHPQYIHMQAMGAVERGAYQDRQREYEAHHAKVRAEKEAKVKEILGDRQISEVSDADIAKALEVARLGGTYETVSMLSKEQTRREQSAREQAKEQATQKRLADVPESRLPAHRAFLEKTKGALASTQAAQHEAFKTLPEGEQDKALQAPRANVTALAGGKFAVPAAVGTHDVGDYVHGPTGEVYRVTGKGTPYQKDVQDAPQASRGEMSINREDRTFTPGEVIRMKDGSFVRVLSNTSRYIPEEGLSMGLSRDSGTIHSAIVRPATEEEAAPVKAYHEQEANRKSAIRALEYDVPAKFREGERPEKVDPYAGGGEVIKANGGRTIYGGGHEFVIAPDKIWLVKGNGADGDDWSYNNAPGAIATALPRTPELEQQIRDLHEATQQRPEYPKPDPLPDGDRGRGGKRTVNHQYHYVTPLQGLSEARPAPTPASTQAPAAPATKAPHADESLRFGKHSGRTLEQIWRAEPGYLTWAAANLNNNALRSKIAAFVAHKKGNA